MEPLHLFGCVLRSPGFGLVVIKLGIGCVDHQSPMLRSFRQRSTSLNATSSSSSKPPARSKSLFLTIIQAAVTALRSWVQIILRQYPVALPSLPQRHVPRSLPDPRSHQRAEWYHLRSKALLPLPPPPGGSRSQAFPPDNPH